MAGSSKLAVGAAIGGNTIVMIAKFIAFGVTGSGAMFSEAIHTAADVLNQILLMIGIVRSNKDADQHYQYGYGRERYIWALMSAVGIFFLGCGFTVYHGISSLLDPHPIGEVGWAMGVLVFALVVEGIVLGIAFVGLWKLKGDKPFFAFLNTEADPTAVAVLLEDAAACLGVLIAMASIGLAKLTGDLYWDAVGSITIGALLGAVAIWLIVRNTALLRGQAVPKHVRARVRDLLESEESVEQVVEMKSRMIDLQTYDIMANIEFDGEVIAKRFEPKLRKAYAKIESYDDFEAFARTYADDVVEALGDEVDRLEEKIKDEIPQAKHLDLETN